MSSLPSSLLYFGATKKHGSPNYQKEESKQSDFSNLSFQDSARHALYVPQYVEYGDINCGVHFLEATVKEFSTNYTENNACLIVGVQ